MRRRVVLSALVPALSIVMALTALRCGKGSGGGSGGDDEVVVEPKSDENGVVVATIDTSSGDTQVLNASADNPELAGAAVAFPPGSLAIPADVTIQQGESLVSTKLLEDAGIPSDTESAGPAVLVTASEDIDATQPFTVALPFDDAATGELHLAPKMLAVLYLVKKAGEDKLFVGIIPASELQIEGAIVRLLTKYFGAYQVIVAESGIDETKEQATEQTFKPKPLDTTTGTKTGTSTNTTTDTSTNTDVAKNAPNFASISLSGEGVEPGMTVAVTFDRDVTLGSATNGGVTLGTGDDGAGPAPAFTVSVDGKTVTLETARRLTLGQKYTVWINGSLKAVGGVIRDSAPEAHAFTVREGDWQANEPGEIGSDYPRTAPYNIDRLSALDSGYALAVNSLSDFGAYLTDASGTIRSVSLSAIAGSVYGVKMLAGRDGSDYYAWNPEEFGTLKRILVNRAGTPFTSSLEAAEIAGDNFEGSDFHYYLGHDGKTDQSYVLTLQRDPQGPDVILRERLIGDLGTPDAVEIGREDFSSYSLARSAFHSARDGRAIVVMTTGANPPVSYVYLRTTSGAWIKSDYNSGPVFVPTADFSCVDAKVLDGDGYMIGWGDAGTGTITGYIKRSTGTTWGATTEETLNIGGPEPVFPYVAVGVGGHAAIHWYDSSSVFGWTYDGTTWTTHDSVTAPNADVSFVGIDAAGRAIVSWRTNAASDYGIRAWHHSGASWEDNAETIESAREYVEFHGMSVEDSGRIYLMWSDDDDSSGPNAASIVRATFK